jgi:hypothetical protein
MKSFRHTFLFLTLLPFTAFAADPGLLKLVMPDAKVLADLQVAQAKVSPFGQYLLGRMQPDDASFQSFITETGFDPRNDLTEVVIASNWQGDQKGQWLVLARGAFNPSMIGAAVLKNGGTVVPFQGVSILTPAGKTAQSGDTVIAFLDTSTGLMGDTADVQAAIQRAQSGSAAFVPPTQVAQLSAQYDFWFLTLVPLSEFSSVMPDGNMGQAMKGNLFQAVLQASGGAKLGAQNVLFGAQAVTPIRQGCHRSRRRRELHRRSSADQQTAEFSLRDSVYPARFTHRAGQRRHHDYVHHGARSHHGAVVHERRQKPAGSSEKARPARSHTIAAVANAELPRRLGLLDATAVVIGVVIGGGIFVVPNLVARSLPSVKWIFACWIFAGIVSFFGALACAELGSAIPATGGQYVFIREAYGRMAGFLYGWSNFLVARSAQVAWLAVTFTLYVSYFLPIRGWAAKALSLAVVALFAAINYVGVRTGAAVQKILMFTKVAGLLVIVGGAFLAAPHASANPRARGANLPVVVRRRHDRLPLGL